MLSGVVVVVELVLVLGAGCWVLVVIGMWWSTVVVLMRRGGGGVVDVRWW